jgi:serine/threonine protein kinase
LSPRIADRLTQEKEIQEKMKSGNPRGLKGLFKKRPQSPRQMDEPPLISGTQGNRAEGGTRYGQITKKLGSGGSDTAIYEVQRLLAPIVQRQTGSGQTSVRPSEPMAVKCEELEDKNGQNKEGVKDLIKEARIMAALGKHKNIVGLIDAHAGKRFYLFMEKGYHDLAVYTPANMKEKKYPPLTPPQIRKYAVDILTGITHMHSKRIYHLDIKPENIILCNANTAKLIDFGLSKTRVLEPAKQTMLDEKWYLYGTPGYRPPESWNLTHYSQERHLMQRDDYAVGMTIFEGLLAHFCKWDGLRASMAEDASTVKKRISYWEELHRKENFRKKLEANGLLILADAAARLIDPVPANRFTAGEALGFIIQDRKQYREDKLSGNKEALNALKTYQFLQTQLSKSRQ